ncbi:chromate efflux transporter [Marinagarivorans cellulosilyticus]|uniref:Chromate transporter n=1 Tax=Marinagarivorans cellulosilyticus TaxID=2721545 RepID=A0AAN1WJ71_9GAMM|nr:chromate efflux transporter [Marinagarivorans cellulosilyticus]BCD98633.1 chromate transporter [Marinagarivorans cellulosilyticus]
MTLRVTEVFCAFLKLGLTAFGGPVAHIGYFYKDFVERKQWLTEQQFAQLLGICQLLPGPASSQLGFCIGLMSAGWAGGLVAFTAFTLPSVLLLLAFSVLLPVLSSTAGQAALHGLKIVAFAVVADAVISMYQKLCPDRLRASIACLSAVALCAIGSLWGQLCVIAAGAVVGVLYCQTSDFNTKAAPVVRVGYGKTTGTILLVAFLTLLAALSLLQYTGNSWLSLAHSFYSIGALVFGGGHVVLPLLNDALVPTGQLTPEAFMAGYGASQAIPGPMFSFAAYLGALIAPEGSALLGAGVALVFIFLPGFLLLAGILPLWQRIAHVERVNNAMAGINAAVVGVLGAALYDPVFTSAVLGPLDMALGLLAIATLRLWQLPVMLMIAGCVLLSVAAAVLL